MSPRPVEKNSIESQTTDNLREFILGGAVKAGARLTEVPLAEKLGIARATLRTGLHRLAAEGLVVQIPYTGWEVVELSVDDVWEIWTLRGSLEGLAAKLVAQAARADRLRDIEQGFAELAAACRGGDLDKVSAADFALHRLIVESADHSRLQRQYRLVEQQVRLSIISSNAIVAEGPDAVLEQHRPIVEAILGGDGDRAAYEAWHHNEVEGQHLMEHLRTATADQAQVRRKSSGA